MAGSYVMIYEMDIANTDQQDLDDCGNLVGFFEAADLTGVSTRNDLAARASRYVLANQGYRYLIYTPDASKAFGLTDLEVGEYRLRWLDLQSGQEFREDIAVQTAGEWLARRPESVGPELALHLERVSSRP